MAPRRHGSGITRRLAPSLAGGSAVMATTRRRDEPAAQVAATATAAIMVRLR